MKRPASTYRLQLNAHFGFSEAEAIVDYLDKLGVQQLYLSPILASRSGSQHGYDVVDPLRLDPELGSPEDFDSLLETTRDHGMGILIDIVPNHMAASMENEWWRDVLKNGRRSKFADFFDIDWVPPWPHAEDQILLPVLGDHYYAVLEAGQLELARFEDGSLGVRYFDNFFPLDPQTTLDLDAGDLEAINTDLDRLDALLCAQNYQLRFWKTQRYEFNYRRFFNISDLVSLRTELDSVRKTTHQKLKHLLKKDGLTGLRIDHVDGLRDPKAYLQWLKHHFKGGDGTRPYVLVEKILAPNEELPEDWPVSGTTGYDFLNNLNGVFVDPDGHRRLDELYAQYTGRPERFREVVYDKKRFVIGWLFQAELDRLVRPLVDIARRARQGRDLTRRELSEALAQISAGLPVYRTYITEPPVEKRARRCIERAAQLSERFGDPIEAAARHFVARILTLEVDEALLEEALEFVMSWQQFTPPVMAKGLEDTTLYVYNHLISLNTVGGEPDEGDVSLAEFHDFNARRLEKWPGSMNATSTHDSKRGEDVRLRVDVLSEMPERWSERLAQWVEWNEPKKMLPQVAEPPSRNEEMLLYQTLLGSWPLDPNALEEYSSRLRQYLIKSAREAKEKTSWHEADEGHEYALGRFAERLLDDAPDNAFLADFIELQREIAFFGAMNSLSQVLLKIASPGVPDFYQGSEFWNLTLVDPDNRRPVDFDRRRASLAQMRQVPREDLADYAAGLLSEWRNARIKQFVTWRVLSFRRDHPALFLRGEYLPLYGLQKARPYLCAFARRRRDDCVIALAPRRLTRLVEPFELPVDDTWADTYLPLPPDCPARWTNYLTGENLEATGERRKAIALDEAFRSLPVALLVGEVSA